MNICKLISITVFLSLLGLGITQAATPKYPFPQHVSYARGTIFPNNFVQYEKDQHVRDFYDDWKNKYLISAGMDSHGNALYRMTFAKDSTITISKGQGYAMVIVALMAGHDETAQHLFNALLYFSKKYPSAINEDLMSWKIDKDKAVEKKSAFEGDVNIAYALLLADAQWGSDGEVNYLQEAKKIISALSSVAIGKNSYLPKLGDWVKENGSTYNQYTLRSSDVMPVHFRNFAHATENDLWNIVLFKSQAALRSIQRNYSSSTGLLPDFIVNCQRGCRPAKADFFESANDGKYHYNAGSIPLWLSLDALLYSDRQSKAQVKKILTWLFDSTDGEINKIKAGYDLDGKPIGNYSTSFFLAPFAVAAMLDSKRQYFLNKLYAALYNKHENAYEDSINLLSLLVLSENYWTPTTVTNSPRSKISNISLCNDDLDNDNDGLIDYPDDKGCYSAQDNDETDILSKPTLAVCEDGLDNDKDGLIDFPKDKGCYSAQDNDETDLLPKIALCADYIDNDKDGLIDFPNDKGCSSAEDNDETDAEHETKALNVKVLKVPAWKEKYCGAAGLDIESDVDFVKQAKINKLWNGIYTQSEEQVYAKLLNGSDLTGIVPSVRFASCDKKSFYSRLSALETEPKANNANPDLLVKIEPRQTWKTGYCADVVVTNNTTSALDWKINFPVKWYVYELWNAQYQQSGQNVTAEGFFWNNQIEAKKQLRFGFCAKQTLFLPRRTIQTNLNKNHPNLVVTIQPRQKWKTGYCADVIVANTSHFPLEWKVNFPVKWKVYKLWDALYQQSGQTLTVEGLSWNKQIDAKKQIRFDFCAKQNVQTTANTPNINDSGLLVKISSREKWKTGYCADVTVTNTTNRSLKWEVSFPVKWTVYKAWNAKYEQFGQMLSVKGIPWNSKLAPKKRVNFGFCTRRDVPRKLTTPKVEAQTLVPVSQQKVAPITTSLDTNTQQDLLVKIKTREKWKTGYCADVIVTNTTNSTLEWKVNFPVKWRVYKSWNATYKQSGQMLTARGISWNKRIAPKKKVSFGFCTRK